MNLWTDRQMEGLSPEEQARKAISHTLSIVRDNPSVGWHVGMGTQTFALLTEAAATLFKEDLETLRHQMACKEPVDADRALRILIEIAARLNEFEVPGCSGPPCHGCVRCLVKEGLPKRIRLEGRP